MGIPNSTRFACNARSAWIPAIIAALFGSIAGFDEIGCRHELSEANGAWKALGGAGLEQPVTPAQSTTGVIAMTVSVRPSVRLPIILN